eukprot:symbB.v1.2.037751.t1/scaffold5529.1/size26123/3
MLHSEAWGGSESLRPILEEKRKLRCGHFAAWGVDIRLLVLITLRLVAETGQVPNQLTISAPTFDPSTDDVEIWSSKVELLSATWPRQRITELATRLILGCKGTAYQKLQLQCAELLVNGPKGIRKLVDLVGRMWGQVLLEKRYEVVEKAVFRNQQKPDETSDSVISRGGVVWTELEVKGINLSQIRSYILLRGSRLSSEGKKKVLVESGAESNGALKLQKAISAIRMLGSGVFRFFQELREGEGVENLRSYCVMKKDLTTKKRFALFAIRRCCVGSSPERW